MEPIPGKIFFAILDWGMGHACRSIPLIRSFKAAGAEVMVASSGRAAQLLRRECPGIEIADWPGYGVKYWFENMFLNIGLQWPRILWAAWREHRKLAHLLRVRPFDLVISDSRFGCFHRSVPCVFMTHQLHIRIPFRPLAFLVNRLNRYLLNRFDEIWVPDAEALGGLSGVLSHPSPFAKTKYLGLLSRMEPMEVPLEYDLLVLLSGPEPQRTRFEKKVLSQLLELPNVRTLLVQGKPESQKRENPAPHIDICAHLAGIELNRALASAGVVLCRSGYSSLMDLARLGKKAIIVPTPGQTEQQYLARRCHIFGWALFQEQKQFNLAKALERIDRLPGWGEGLMG